MDGAPSEDLIGYNIRRVTSVAKWNISSIVFNIYYPIHIQSYYRRSKRFV
jgi:hypothetical protein